MAENIEFRKVEGVFLTPANEEGKAQLKSLKGEVFTAKISIKRNGAFFRKWWKLIDYAFENWDTSSIEPLEFNGNPPQKNRGVFRKNVTIGAGHYEEVISYNHATKLCEVKREALSISWANMKEHEFNEFYSASIDAILLHFLPSHTKEDVTQGVLSFG